MKRILIFLAVAALVAVGLLVTFQYASAQEPTPMGPGGGYGPGMRGGMSGGGMRGAGQGVMHADMQAALAAKLGMTVEDYQKAYAEGKTFWQIAEEKGFTVEEAQQMKVDARAEALDAAVANGTITQEQADWMKQRMNNQTPGSCQGMNGTGGGRGMMGRGGRGNR